MARGLTADLHCGVAASAGSLRTAPLSGQEITHFFLTPLKVLRFLLQEKDHIIACYKSRLQVCIIQKSLN